MKWTYNDAKFDYNVEFADWKHTWAGHKFFGYDLVRNLKPKVIVELGTYIGSSFFAMSQAVKDAKLNTQLNAVDTWEGDTQTGFYDGAIFDFFTRLQKTYYQDLDVVLHRKLFNDAARTFKNGSIDILHIDGLHTYEAVKEDFETWIDKVKDDGIVLFHDIVVQKDDFGVYKYWEELKAKYATFDFAHSNGLGVLFKDSKVADELKSEFPNWQAYYEMKTEIQALSSDLNIEIVRNQEMRNTEASLRAQNLLLLEENDTLRIHDVSYEELTKQLDEFNAFKKGLIWKLLTIYRFLKRNIVRLITSPKDFQVIFKVLAEKGFKGLKLRYKSINLAESYFLKLRHSYGAWVRANSLTNDVIQSYKDEIKRDNLKTRFSIILPTYNTDEIYLRKCLDSVLNQIYENWELCIADDASTALNVRKVLEEYSKKDNRIKVVFRTENGHICKSSNSALELATGEYLCLLDHDDEISQDALFKVAREIHKKPKVDYIYSDEDKIELNGLRVDPHFKANWSIDTLYSFMYSGHLSTYRKSIIDQIGGFRVGTHGSQDYDMLLRALPHIKEVVHIPEMLYRWRKFENSTALSLEAKPYAMKAGQEALEFNLKSKVKSEFEVENTGKGFFYLRAKLKPSTKVELFVRNSSESLIHEVKKQLAEFSLTVTQFDSLIDLADSLKKSKSEFGIVINDIQGKVVNPKDLQTWLAYLNVENVGIVGPKLLDRETQIDSAGLVISRGRVETPFKGFYDFVGYANNLITTQNHTGVDGRFFAINLDLYKKAAIKFSTKNDKLYSLDISNRLWSKGIRTAFVPYITVEAEKSVDYSSEQYKVEFERLLQDWSQNEVSVQNFYNSSFTGETLYTL